MTVLHVVLGVLFFAVALVFSMLGQGGGALYTPLQVLGEIGYHEAAMTSLFLIVVVSASSVLVFGTRGKVDVPLVVVLESVTAAGGFVGGRGASLFQGPTLSVGFALFVSFAAFFMIRGTAVKPDERSCAEHGRLHWLRELPGGQEYCVNLGIALPISFLAGLASGLLGVGGGLLKVPLMVLLLGIPMDIAIGSSALMVGITAAAGFLGHLSTTTWNWKLSLALGVVVFLGAQIGPRFALKVDKAKLKRWFGILLLVLAVSMVLKATRILPGLESPASGVESGSVEGAPPR